MSDTENGRTRAEAASEAVKPMTGTRRELVSSALKRYLAAEQQHAVSGSSTRPNRTGPDTTGPDTTGPRQDGGAGEAAEGAPPPSGPLSPRSPRGAR